MSVVLASKTPAVRRRPSNFLLKQVMAVTGIIFVGFVFIHMIGNLKVYGGPDSLNGYARWLREVGYPLIPKKGVLWVLRVVLASSVILHIWSSVTLWLRGRKARGAHRRRRMSGLTPSLARTMLPGGLIIIVFVLVHLLDLTIGALVTPDAHRHADADGTIHAYSNLVASFSRPWMAIFYSGTMIVIAAHIVHGWRTVAQDVGATATRLRKVWVGLGVLLALGVLLGNALIPVLVQLGVIA